MLWTFMHDAYIYVCAHIMHMVVYKCVYVHMHAYIYEVISALDANQSLWYWI